MTTSFMAGGIDRRISDLGLARPRRGAPAPMTCTPGAQRLSLDAAANFLGVSSSTMRSWRRRGQGPAHYEYMGRLAYDVAELERYQADRARS